MLSGRMVQRGNDLAVTLDLLDVDRQAQLWGGRFNRKMTDLIALQEELASEIAEKLRLQLSGEEKKKLRKRPTQNNEAFRLLLQARHFMARLSPEGLSRAVELCERVIKIDPAYAAAHANLSFAYGVQGFFGYADSAEDMLASTTAAKRALELDDTLAEAHGALAYALLRQWDFAGAEQEARRSLELSPDSVFGLLALQTIRMVQGRFDEGIAAGKRAAELDPLDGLARYALGVSHLYAGQFDQAIEQERKALEIDPANPIAHNLLAIAYAFSGQRDKAMEMCRGIGGLLLATVNSILGETQEARRALEDVTKDWASGGQSAFLIASCYGHLRDNALALQWLEKAFQERAPILYVLKITPAFRALHGDPRFDALVKRIGIPD